MSTLAPRVVNDNGAWCWFQDERALIDPVAKALLVGSIAAPEGPGGAERAGHVELAAHDLTTGETRVLVLHENFEATTTISPILPSRSLMTPNSALNIHRNSIPMRNPDTAQGKNTRAW